MRQGSSSANGDKEGLFTVYIYIYPTKDRNIAVITLPNGRDF